jgi:Asp-tRNA(Asn)/Glu-tRNA(Gln) amidotransferase A subunit family amidase
VAGAIILGKANMGEYASGSRSTYQGQVCNPYATDRSPGGSSSGSGAAVAANLVTCAIAEESLGSIRNPAAHQGIVGLAPTCGLVSREGNFRANLIRERLGPHCRTVKDIAIVLDAIAGYDPGDPITAASVGRIPGSGYAAYVNKKGLVGKRIGIIREFMTPFSVADDDSIRVMNQAIADMKAAGAEVVESVNDRDCHLFGACGDPTIPDMNPTIQDTIEELLPYLEPSFVGPTEPAGA